MRFRCRGIFDEDFWMKLKLRLVASSHEMLILSRCPTERGVIKYRAGGALGLV